MNNLLLFLHEILDVALGWVKTIVNMVTTVPGVMVSIITFFLNLIIGNEMAFYAAFVAIFFDLFWGSVAAIKRKKFILSCMLTKTFTKLFLYVSVFIMVLFLEKGLNDDWYLGTRLVCTFAAGCELWSTMANMLIVKPDFPFISLLRKSLTGEIAEKMKLSKEEVEAEFNKYTRKKNGKH